MKPSENELSANYSRRRVARLRVVQLLYQWQLSSETEPDSDLDTAIEDYLAPVDPSADVNANETSEGTQEHNEEADIGLSAPFDKAYFKQLWRGVVEQRLAIDEKITSVIDRPITSLTPIEYAVLRLGTYELFYEPNIPPRVVINEALEITKYYGTIEGYKYVNAVLDKLNRLKGCQRGTLA